MEITFGNLTYLWRIPQRIEDRCDEKTIGAVVKVKADMKNYSTCAMRKAFFDRYQKAVNISPAILRDMYRYLTGDNSASDTKEQAVVDQRVVEFILHSDEADLMFDLRVQNGQTKGTKFDRFWQEVSSYFDEYNPAVQERRQTQTLYLPLAMSIEDLREIVKKRLPPDAAVPSNEWIRLQFWPKNTTAMRAIHHTGRFNIKFAVQQRLLRATHPDAKYAAHQLKLLKSFAVHWKEHSDLVFLDDKAAS